ncbi:MAG: hypothetical protein ACUVUC_12105 [Thermoguttaceae bacterium]
MPFNFFQWIREGVKYSVLSGVSDAVQHLGTPRQQDDIHQRLTAFLQDGRGGSQGPLLPGHCSRKKLGRGLPQIQTGSSESV